MPSPDRTSSPEAAAATYRALQRRFHPDLNGSAGAIASSPAYEINEAYSVLRCPVQRADYLLHLLNYSPPSPASATVSDPELLEEVLFWRERGRAAAEEAQRAFGACVSDLASAFDRGDLRRAHRLTDRLKFLQAQLRLDARLH